MSAPRMWLSDTRDLADQDYASGHLTEFWRSRVEALLELLEAAERAGAPAGALELSDRRPAPPILVHECQGILRPYPPGFCSTCKPSEPVGVMTLEELVTAFNALRLRAAAPRDAMP